MRTFPRRSKPVFRSGFSLVEVLVALVVLALTLHTVGQTTLMVLRVEQDALARFALVRIWQTETAQGWRLGAPDLNPSGTWTTAGDPETVDVVGWVWTRAAWRLRDPVRPDLNPVRYGWRLGSRQAADPGRFIEDLPPNALPGNDRT